GRYPVTGTVKFDDGKPLETGNLICEGVIDGKTVMARGAILADGTFTLGTLRPGDGVRPGKYRVLVSPRGLSEAELAQFGPTIDHKFESFETSGLTLEVTD